MTREPLHTVQLVTGAVNAMPLRHGKYLKAARNATSVRTLLRKLPVVQAAPQNVIRKVKRGVTRVQRRFERCPCCFLRPGRDVITCTWYDTRHGRDRATDVLQQADCARGAAGAQGTP